MGPKADILNNTVFSSVNIMKELLMLLYFIYYSCEMQQKSEAINFCK